MASGGAEGEDGGGDVLLQGQSECLCGRESGPA